ncbi:MAG TPA: hypothetical protein VGB92_06115 [Longimicrobium sp.]|jgi:hypothetical protein
MTDFRLESHPAAESHRLLDFDSAHVTPGFIPGTYFLTVAGTKPCSNMTVTLSPLIYIRCPEYWGIEVVGHLPHGICLNRIAPYEETIPLTGIIGSAGIEVIGARRTERFEIEGGCSQELDFSAGPGGDRFIVIALTGSEGEKHQGCKTLPENAIYPRIYSQVFGPASREECERWTAEKCGFDGGDPPE